MKILYYGLRSKEDFEKMRKEEMEKYLNSTVTDFVLNRTIQYIRERSDDFDRQVSSENYQKQYSEFLKDVIGQLNCFQKIFQKIYDFYMNHNEYIDQTSLLSLLREQSFADADEVTAFFENTAYLKWREYNRDNFFTVQNHIRMIWELTESLQQIRDEFVQMPYKAAAQKVLNDKITITEKSSAVRYCLALLRAVKWVRQIRWLAWLEDFLFLLLFSSTATISSHYKYIVLLPEFFFVDIDDNPKGSKTTGYVKPFYEDIARYFTGCKIDYYAAGFLEKSLQQSRLADLTALYDNLIIFAGTMVWKTKDEHFVYTNGEEVVTKEKEGYTRVYTDTFFNTAVLFSGGRCCYLWDKQFVSPVDGTGGIKVIHKHEVPSLEDFHYIKSSMSMELQMESPVMLWGTGEETIRFLLSICMDFGVLADRSYDPIPDIHILIAEDIGLSQSRIKGKYFLLVCDGHRTPASICYDIQQKKAVRPLSQGVFCQYLLELPDFRPQNRESAVPLTEDSSFYEKVLQEGLRFADTTEAAAFGGETEADFVCIDQSVITELRITEEGGRESRQNSGKENGRANGQDDSETATGSLTITGGDARVQYPVTVTPSNDPETGEVRVEVTLNRIGEKVAAGSGVHGEDRAGPVGGDEEISVTAADIALLVGGMSNTFLEALQLPLGAPTDFRYYFYENGHREYQMTLSYQKTLPLVPELLSLENAGLTIIRSDDIYQYTLSAMVDIAGCDVEFGVISGSLDLVQAYFQAAAPEGELPGLAQFAGWALGGQTEDLNNLPELPLLDLSLLSVKAFLRTGEQLCFEEFVLRTRLTLFCMNFFVELCLVGRRLRGFLETDQGPQSVAGIVGSMFPEGHAPAIPEALGTLYIEQASLEADIKNREYDLSCSISGAWEAGMVRLEGLKLSLAGGGEEKTLSFSGQLTLMEMLTVQVGIFDENNIWRFQGGVSIPEGKSLYDLFQSFGWQGPGIFRRMALNYVTIAAAPQTGELQLACAAALEVEELWLQFLVTGERSESGGVYTGEVSFAKRKEDGGTLQFPGRFLVSFQEETGENLLSLEWKQEAGFSITDFCSLLGFESFELPEFLDITIAELKGVYDFDSKEFTFLAKTVENNSLYIRSELTGDKRQVIFGVALDMKLGLDSLPVVGDSSSLMKEVALGGLKALLLSADYEHLTIDALDIADQALPKGLILAAELQLPDDRLPLMLPVAAGKKAPAPGAEPAGNTVQKGETRQSRGEADPSGEISVRIDKHIGPFVLRKLKATYSSGTLGFAMDSGFEQGALSFALEGLGIGYRLADKKPSVLLEGLSVNAETVAVTIGGSFCQVDSQTYRGSLLLGLASLQIAAYGAYTTEPSQSAFVFALLRADIGGPPCFMVTGLAAGFGYNRNLSLPDIEHLSEFPFLQAVQGELTADRIFEQEMTYFPPETGENWLAAGVLFHSFKMVNSMAMLSVRFGNETEIHLLGESVVDVPYQAATPIGHAVLLLNASFAPAANLVAVEAALSNESYILSKACHLTGSFAFYTWYGGDHEGDFVITLGGYHRLYQKPEHYPDARRLGLDWKIADGLTAQGEIYFALTPSALMAGGRLKLQYTASRVEAWFDAHMDALIQWKPYHYDLSIGVNIGVRVHLTLFTAKLELGCDLHLWGPEFSGTVKVKLWIISFTISFIHSENQTDASIEPKEFVASFLPESGKGDGVQSGETVPYAGCTISVNKGIQREITPKEGEKAYVLCAECFEITVKSCVPANVITFMKETVYTRSPETPAAIRPCGDAALDTEFTVSLERRDGVPIEEEFFLTVLTENLPAALWASKDRMGETIPLATGLRIQPKTRGYYQLICQEDFENTSISVVMKAPASIASKSYEQAKAFEYLEQITEAEEKRNAIISGLGEEFQDVRLDRLAAASREVFTEPPLIATIGGSGAYCMQQSLPHSISRAEL